jgi:hypothetical protein
MLNAASKPAVYLLLLDEDFYRFMDFFNYSGIGSSEQWGYFLCTLRDSPYKLLDWLFGLLT